MSDLLQKGLRRSWRGISLFLCLVTACQNAPASATLIVPLPTPHILEVQVTPALQSLRAQFHDCTDEQPSTGLVISNTPAPAIDLQQAALALRWGMRSKPEGYAAEIGQETLAVVVSKQSTLKTIAIKDLQSIYQGKLRAWPGAARAIHAWTYPGGDDIAQVFETAVLAGGSISSIAVYTAPDPEAMLEALSKDADAVGYLPGRWMDDSVKKIDIEGIHADSLRQPVIALSKSEPEGPEKSWLLCLQAHLTE